MMESFEKSGYALHPAILDTRQIEALRLAMDSMAASLRGHARGGKVFAVRDVFSEHPEVWKAATGEVLRTIVSPLAGSDAKPTKATLFDKRPEANWSLPLHQDLTITVRARANVPGYTHWSVKAGIPHVQPPIEVLERIVALRIHLDDCPIENGALEVVPGSHRLGRLSPETLRGMYERGEAIACPVSAGDVLAMRPLLVHGSRKALCPTRRRVLHVEYASVELDAPLQWPEWSISDPVSR